MKYVIVGGVAGGASAAARLRRLDENAEIVVFEKGEYISYANCGLPYYIGDVINNREKLFVQTPVSFGNRYDVDVRTLQEVTAIDREKHTVEVQDLRSWRVYSESYDVLLLSPGALPVIPDIPGVRGNNIFTLRNVADCDNIKKKALEFLSGNASTVVVGGGFIGLEMAENLRRMGFVVTLVEKADHILTPTDLPIAAIAQQHVSEHGVRIITNTGVSSFSEDGGRKKVILDNGEELTCDLVILSIGVRPNASLAENAGLEIGKTGGITVNKYLQTSDKDIYAVGDVIEFPHPITGVPYCNFLAGPANAQARIAAMNMVHPESTAYNGSVSTAIAKIFDLTVACTGMSEKALERAGIAFETVIVHPAAHATYYPGGSQISLKLNFSPENGRILGAQAIGKQNVDKQIDVISLLLKHNGTVYDLVGSEHSYAPPFGSAKSPVMFAGMVAENILTHLMNPIHVKDLDRIIDNNEDFFLLDVRELPEYRNGTIKGAVRYSVDELREFLDEIPSGKKIVVFCEVGLRGYVASRILMQNGFENVCNLIGGMRTYRMTGHNLIKP